MYVTLIAILACSLGLAFSGCVAGTPAEETPSENEPRSELPSDPPEELESAPESVTAESSEPEPVSEEAGETDTLTEPPTDAAEDVANRAMEFAGRLGYDIDELFIVLQDEVAHFDEFWLWRCDLDGPEGPVATVYVREDLRRVESFDAYAEFAFPAIEPGGELPDLTADALGLHELGFRPAQWASHEGHTVYRKHVSSGDWDISVGNVIIRFLPEMGDLIGILWLEDDLVAEVSVQVGGEDAISIAAGYLDELVSSVTHVDLVQIQDGISRVSDMNIYWEIQFGDSYVYVRCNDGEVAVSDAGPSEPLGF